MVIGLDRAMALQRSVEWLQRLDRKTHQMGLTDSQLCEQHLHMSRAQFSRAKNGKEMFPRSKIPIMAELLGVDAGKIVEELYPDPDLMLEQPVSDEDLKFFLAVVEAAGTPLSLSTLVGLLKDRKKNQAS